MNTAHNDYRNRFSTNHRRVNTYNNGQPYVPARGRYASRDAVEDYAAVAHPVLRLPADRPTADRFLQVIVRELKIRCYQQKTIKTYRNAVGKFLTWFGAMPHQVTREDVRNYLETLVDGGADSSWISTNLSAIRTTFDKLCGASVTLGLVSPRRRKKLPVVLSRDEVVRLLESAVSLRDKLSLGLMYATGVRVSEVVRLRWRDFDFDRLVVNVWEGKGRTDRVVMLPQTFRPLLQQLSQQFAPEDYVFPGEIPGRYLSPQTVRRAMARAVRLAGIAKKATPHSLRHGFACHLLEDGTDIRFIQKFLGHVKLETTTIYTRVAQPRAPQRSPLDALTGAGAHSTRDGVPAVDGLSRVLDTASQRSVARRKPLGTMRLHMRLAPLPADETGLVQVTIEIRSDDRPIYLKGIRVQQARRGWLNLEIPPLEDWSEPLRWLTPSQRERIESAEFYELLQSQIRNRYPAIVSSSA
jgi:site-specific recombinase XerD